MYVPFDSLSETSRIWVYQAGRRFTTEEEAIISTAFSSFSDQWSTHGAPMKASFNLRFHQFIILAADETYTAASGCSIDDSIRMIKEVQANLNLDFFDRTLIAFKKDEQSIETYRLSDLKQKFNEGAWNESSLTFNNLVNMKGQLNTHWILPAGNTWLKRYAYSERVLS